MQETCRRMDAMSGCCTWQQPACGLEQGLCDCRFYNKAFGCIPALREACIEHKKGTVFNMFLEQMASKYEHDQLRADFWKRVMEAKISLISDDELADVGVSRQESEAFVKQHTPGQQVNSRLLLCSQSNHGDV